MNLYLVPKYTKYNKSLKKVRIVTEPNTNYVNHAPIYNQFISKPEPVVTQRSVVTPRKEKSRSKKLSNVMTWAKSSYKNISNLKLSTAGNDFVVANHKSWWKSKKRRSSDASRPSKQKWYDKKKSSKQVEVERTQSGKNATEYYYDQLGKKEQERLKQEFVNQARRERDREIAELIRLQELEKAKARDNVDNKKAYTDIQNAEDPKSKREIILSEKQIKTIKKAIKKPKKVKQKKVKSKARSLPVTDEELYTVKDDLSTQARKSVKASKKLKRIKETKISVGEHYNPCKKRRQPFKRRFVSCFYRFCCEFYCWLTIITIVTCFVLFNTI